jgi:hypothetical protein
MQQLIVVRHGEYVPDKGDITKDSSERLVQLGARLKQLLNGVRPKIYTSLIHAAGISGGILASTFEAETLSDEILWLDDKHPLNLEGIYQLVAKEERWTKFFPVVVMLVTHSNVVTDFPPFFGKQFLNADLEPLQADYGQAVIVDCEKKTAELIG